MKSIKSSCHYHCISCILKQRAFTIIELITVIAIIGIVAAVAVPMMTDLTPDAKQSATQGIAGALNAASATNYGKRKANSASGVAVNNCTDIGLLMAGGLPSDYSIVSQSIANDSTVTCVVKRVDNNSIQATFVGLGIS